MKTIIRNDSGQALVLVMMLVLLILLMSLSMLTQGRENYRASFDEHRIAQVGYTAEAGIEKVLAKIKHDPLWLGSLAYNKEITCVTAQEYAGGVIASVKIKKTSKTVNPVKFDVESQGKYQDAKRTILVDGEMYDPIDFSKGIWTKTPLSQPNGGCWIDSNIVCGDADFPVLDEYWYAKNADYILTSDLAGMFSIDGVSYTPGSIRISGTYSGRGAIVAGGKVTINGDLKMRDEDAGLAVISFDNATGIETGSNSTVHALLYCPGGIYIGSGSYVQGSAVCGTVDFGPGASFVEDQTIQNIFPHWITTVVNVIS